jgi:sugar lactone lactonase YvrE
MRRLLGCSLVSALVLSAWLGAAVGAAPTGKVIASGLINPRYLTVLDDGTIYVSEAGTGGTEALPVPPGSQPSTPPATRGTTGQVTKIAADGTKTVVVKGLPSYNTEGPVGPAGILYANGALWLAIGGSALPTKVTPLANENAVVKIDPATGAVTRVADVGAYEQANNAAKNNLDSNLYGIALGPDGNLLVADAGGDILYKVNPSTGALTPTVIPCIAPPPGLQAPPGGNPECPNSEPKLDSVPTSPAVGPDGTVYVGLLSGGPFIPGTAQVDKVAADGTVSVAVKGLTMVTSVAFGPDKTMYVTELSTNFTAQGGPKPGQVLRVLPDGSTQVVVDNLMLPNGITFDKAGNLYVVTNTVALGPGAPQGMVMRYDGVAAAAAPAPAPTPTPVMPGLPNTGAGGGQPGGLSLLPLLALPFLGLGLAALRRRAVRERQH